MEESELAEESEVMSESELMIRIEEKKIKLEEQEEEIKSLEEKLMIFDIKNSKIENDSKAFKQHIDKFEEKIKVVNESLFNTDQEFQKLINVREKILTSLKYMSEEYEKNDLLAITNDYLEMIIRKAEYVDKSFKENDTWEISKMIGNDPMQIIKYHDRVEILKKEFEISKKKFEDQEKKKEELKTLQIKNDKLEKDLEIVKASVEEKTITLNYLEREVANEKHDIELWKSDIESSKRDFQSLLECKKSFAQKLAKLPNCSQALAESIKESETLATKKKNIHDLLSKEKTLIMQIEEITRDMKYMKEEIKENSLSEEIMEKANISIAEFFRSWHEYQDRINEPQEDIKTVETEHEKQADEKLEEIDEAIDENLCCLQ